MCPSASWKQEAETFAMESDLGSNLNGIFVNINNTVYAINQSKKKIIMWFKKNEISVEIQPSKLSGSMSIFVTLNGDIYFDNGKHGEHGKQVEKWTVETNTSIPVMTVDDACYGLFIDISDNIYCSMSNIHQVVKQSLNSTSLEQVEVVAGTGRAGTGRKELNFPCGIFVDLNYDLYVADSGNNRIQLFHSGEKDGITVVGEKATNPLSLQHPTGIILDADHNLFIVDRKHRIVRSERDGFRCIAACSNTTGSGSNQLSRPRGLSFDSHGNIYVSDYGNDRIQKFLLSTNSCGKCFSYF